MKTWVITCTGGRPEALTLCNHYMNRQGHKDFGWIVVDDGPEAAARPSRADHFIRRECRPHWSPDGPSTLIENLLTGLGILEHHLRYGESEKDLVILVEDDDWYHPGYVGLMENYAQNLPPGKMLFGESHTRYYNVRWRTYRQNDNAEHASLCSTCFTTDFIPRLTTILDEADPARPFVDVTAFTKHRDLAMLFPTNLVCGMKGLPGRPGIGHGHSDGIKRITRDPHLEVLQDWIGEDVWRYREFYHDEEMKDVPILEEQKNEPWAIREIRKRLGPESGICGIFRQPGVIPDLNPFAAGAFRHGYLNEFLDIAEARNMHFPKFDLVVISGGFLRHGGLNGVVHEHYRAIGVPVVICDPGRLVKGTQRIYINKEGWLPPGPCPRDRLELLGLEYVPRPRGENILIVGQRPDLDNQLSDALALIRIYSDRELVYRPHPNMWRPEDQELYEVPYDRISIGGDRIDDDSRATLDEDLDNAWCVVTHSSIVAVTALLRGIPVIASNEIVCSDVVMPLEGADQVEHLERPDWYKLNEFLRRWSYTVWFERELRDGSAFAFLKQYLQEGDR